ncbi:MAG TPA: hypothetical protein VIH72_04260 [Candidatus Acidoferrales bacterium]
MPPAGSSGLAYGKDGAPDAGEHGFITQQLFDARIKAHEIIQEHLKQIITIASGTLALTVSFLKDVVGASGAKSTCAWFLPAAWLGLAVSILCAVVCMAMLVNNLDAPDLDVSTIKPFIKAFGAGTKIGVLRMEQAALGTFAIGMLSLAAFGAINFRLFLDRNGSGALEHIEQPAMDINHFAVIPDPEHIGPRGEKHSHTFLLDQRSGDVWDLICQPNGMVEFRRVTGGAAIPLPKIK